MKNEAWAIIVDGKINLHSLGHTKRSTMVNWLISLGVQVFAYLTDAEVERMWECYRNGYAKDAELVPVSILVDRAVTKALIDHLQSGLTTKDMEEIGRLVSNDLLGKEDR